jgi:hypothetical protein
MGQSKLQVYDPPPCCSSGACGPNVDPDLVRFSSDLDWLRQQGVEIERYNLSSHPAAFAREETVREALSKEGNDCLPLILANGSIVSRGVYPSRSELMKFAGIDEAAKEAQPEDTPGASTRNPRSEPALCGPGCDCGAASGGKGIKIAVSLVVLLAVVGILAYKAASARQTASNDPAAEKASVFTVAQAAPEIVPGTAKQPSNGMDETKAVENAVKAKNKVGEYLGSLGDLNKVALSQDAVFIFIPGAKNEAIQDQTNEALLAAQRTLKSNGIALGLYTLPTSSPDHSVISAQVQPPAILVAIKGKGMAAVSGDVTETKLLQAFMASSQAGCCGPSGAGCK